MRIGRVGVLGQCIADPLRPHPVDQGSAAVAHRLPAPRITQELTERAGKHVFR
jgi:hypothetical protein